MATQATISNSGGSDVLIQTGAAAAFWFPPDGFPPPVITPNVTTVSAPFVDSVMPTHMTLDPTALSWVVYVSGSDADQLNTRIERLQSALLQFSFTVTEERDGVVKVWSCWPGVMSPTDQGRDYEMQAAFLAKFAVTIPCHPTPA